MMNNRTDSGKEGLPYIVCHMMTSLNGKITGPFMKLPETRLTDKEYERINTSYRPHAWLCGPNAEMYIVSVDPSGKLGWTQNDVDYMERPRAHIIEVLTNRVSDAYISYLRKYDISYIFAGDDSLNCTLAAEKLKTLFGIEVLMLSGGGFINWSFLQEELVDELSIVMAPVTDGETNTVTLFEKADYLPPKAPVACSLISVEPLEGDSIWLRYSVKK